jgi:hypothetical protein
MLPHGPDTPAFEHASNVELKPTKLTGTMAFMFETRFPQRVTEMGERAVHAAAELHRLLEGPEEALRPDAQRAEIAGSGQSETGSRTSLGRSDCRLAIARLPDFSQLTTGRSTMS